VFGPALENIAGVTHPLSGGERIELPEIGVELEVIAVPGHTRGHIAYYGPNIDDDGALFCGDTLFGAGCGRLFEGTPAQMQESLAKLAVLPAPTLVYCAHEYTQSNMRFALAVEPGSVAVQRRSENVAEDRAKGPRDDSDPHPDRTRNQSLPALGCARRARRGGKPARTRFPPTRWKPSPPSANGRTASERGRNQVITMTTRRNFIKDLPRCPPPSPSAPAGRPIRLRPIPRAWP
jgi:hydroxyacylglutathione hydrolase